MKTDKSSKCTYCAMGFKANEYGRHPESHDPEQRLCPKFRAEQEQRDADAFASRN